MLQHWLRLKERVRRYRLGVDETKMMAGASRYANGGALQGVRTRTPPRPADLERSAPRHGYYLLGVGARSG